MIVPPFRSRPLEPSVSLRLPPFINLHRPATLRYHFSNPTSDVLRLSLSFDSAPEPGTFVFAGPRREPSFVLVPDEERDLEITVVPLALGSLALPRLRVFVHEVVAAAAVVVADDSATVSDGRPSIDSSSGANDAQQRQQTRTRELLVVAENDMATVGGLAPGSGSTQTGPKDFVVMVLP